MGPNLPVTVAHIVHNLDVGGLERVVISLIDGLDRERYRPVLVSLQDGGQLLSDVHTPGLKVYGLRKGSGVSMRALGRLCAILRRERVDIIHCHNHGALSYGTIASLLAGRGSVVYTAHGVRSAGRLRDALFGIARRRARRVVAVSEDVRRVAAERGAMDPGRTELIINGIDARRFVARRDREAVRASLGIDPHVFVYGIVARLTPVKDHSTLLRAFAQVRAGRNDVRLLIVGSGESESMIREHVEQLGFSDTVILTGDRRDVPELLSAMDAFVLSSYSEGLSITLLEAMAASLPIAATRVGGNPEIVLADETGLLVEPRDPSALAAAMNFFVEHPTEAREMGAAGRVRVAERFSEPAMVAAYERVYQNVLDEKRG